MCKNFGRNIYYIRIGFHIYVSICPLSHCLKNSDSQNSIKRTKLVPDYDTRLNISFNKEHTLYKTNINLTLFSGKYHAEDTLTVSLIRIYMEQKVCIFTNSHGIVKHLYCTNFTDQN